MTHDQIVIIAILAATIAMFLWGRWRHDMVAAGALLACILAGIVPGSDAFAGFGHPAIITVACVLVLSYGLQITGAVDALAQHILPKTSGATVSIAALAGLAALLSGFMNNVGALALLMPVALQIADKQNLPPGKVLMPLSFAAILGGTITLIGTPPNLIVSSFRAQAHVGNFGMFDFTPVGLTITVVGVLFVSLIGWRLVPARQQSDTNSFDTGSCITEVRIPAGSKAVGKTLLEVEQTLFEADAQIIGLVRNDFRLSAPNTRRVLRADDILVLEAEPTTLATVLANLGLVFEENVPITAGDGGGETADECRQAENADVLINTKSPDTVRAPDNEDSCPGTQEEKKPDVFSSEETVLQELVVMPNAALLGRSASDISLRTLYGLNLLAISHQGRRSIKRLRTTAMRAGDVLLMEGAPEALSGFAAEFGCLPLAKRDIRIHKKGQAITAVAIMALAVGVAAFGLLPVAISFSAGVLAFMALKIIPLRSVYQAVDWPVIVLLGAMLPVAEAMKTTGTADVIARFLLDAVARGNAVAGLAVILIATMLLTDFMNNAATAAVMCPISISTAAQLNANPDAFLMAVAVGASCAFLTPIGHQNNTIILGPSGFRFSDYWRMGLPTDILVVALSMPVLLLVWPL
jgi:di/tricarboxylate transporter